MCAGLLVGEDSPHVHSAHVGCCVDELEGLVGICCGTERVHVDGTRTCQSLIYVL